MPKIIQLKVDTDKVFTTQYNQYMMLKLTKNQNISDTNNNKINFDTIMSSNSKDLFFENGGIRVGKNISKIRVDLSLWLEATSFAYSEIHIVKNAYNATTAIFPHNEGGESWRSMTSFCYIDVQENDMIYAYTRFNTASSYNRVAGSYDNSCLLSVQVIE